MAVPRHPRRERNNKTTKCARRGRGVGGRRYYWDGENRLTTAQKQDYSKRLEFTYDYMGRRVRTVTRNGGSGSTIVSDRRFLYDGWNVIAELDALQGGSAYTCVRSFTWGLDVTSTIHGAGGVGGLLMIGDGSATHLPVYDANGNVRGLLNGSNGAWTAAYGYTAFGEVVQAVGSYAAANPIRFASKWQDTDTGLYNHNHRMYSPKLGRFISRDPIAENGGLNLYAYVGNDPIGHWDYLGQGFFDFITKPLKKIGKWIKKNATAIVGAVLSVVAPPLGFAFNTAVGLANGGIKGMFLGMAGSFVGGTTWGGVGLNLGGRIAGSIGNAFNFGANSFARAAVNGYFTGGVSGGVSASLAGGSFSSGFKAGATTGAVLAGGLWTWRNPGAPAQAFRQLSNAAASAVHRLGAGVGVLAPLPAGRVNMPPVEFIGYESDLREAEYQRNILRVEKLPEKQPGYTWTPQPSLAEITRELEQGFERANPNVRSGPQPMTMRGFQDTYRKTVRGDQLRALGIVAAGTAAPFVGGYAILYGPTAGAAVWNGGTYLGAAIHGTGYAVVMGAQAHPIFTINAIDFVAQWTSRDNVRGPGPYTPGGVLGVGAQAWLGNPLEW